MTIFRLTRFFSGSRLEGNEVGEEETEIFENVRNVHFIDVTGSSDFFGHTYYRDNPAALSDIALLIGTGAKPGSKIRPLIFKQNNFRELPVGYPDQFVAQSQDTQ